MQAEIDQLNASKVELEKRISEAQAASSAASEQAAQQLQSEKDEAIKKAEADKEELAKAKEELEAAKKKMEEDNAVSRDDSDPLAFSYHRADLPPSHRVSRGGTRFFSTIT